MKKLLKVERKTASVQGTASVILKRKVRDIFINGYNIKIMRIHKANHDLQLVLYTFVAT